MNFNEIVQQNLQQQLQQQQLEQQRQNELKEQQFRQQMESELQKQQAPADENWIAFEMTVNRIFREWTALQLALTNEWGGRATREAAEEMKQDVLDLFLMGKPVYTDQIEAILDESLSQDLNTVAEDGSYKQVAQLIIQCFNFCVHGQYNEINNLLGPETASSVKNCIKIGNDDDDDVSEMGDDSEMMDDDDDMMDDGKETIKKYSEPDEDGWVTVQKK
ncbi:hypothetical protein CYY_003350 [Polysphondylium violaceum]|uniref:Pre-rRNA-processing protein TSR2 n=1 Tax=Polysphondylium violaceum TaxID=133409 RepID=A0A8J4V8T0_9MYCE|nr:hypothetical protein CYY_003350 [Polysphondylium violaceum]